MIATDPRPGLPSVAYPALVGTPAEQHAERILARVLVALRVLEECERDPVDATAMAVEQLARECAEARLEAERFEALVFMTANVVDSWKRSD